MKSNLKANIRISIVSILPYVLVIPLFFLITSGCNKPLQHGDINPTCSFISPANGDELLKGVIKTISVKAEDTGGFIAEVILRIDNTGTGTALSFPYNYQWNTSDTPPGRHTLSITVKDNTNNEISSEIYVFVVEEGDYIHETGTVDDFDGNTYKTVKIGNQWWMAENLKTTHFYNGTEINLVLNDATWNNNTLTDKAFCYYNDSSGYADIYGALYNWAAAMNGAGSSDSNPGNVRGVCPDGWHLPGDREWIELEMELGMSYDDAWLTGWRGTIEGSELKTTFGWDMSGNGTNTSGFSALPAGFRTGNGSFSGKGTTTYFWSSTEYVNMNNYAFNRQLSFNESRIGWFRASHFYGYPKDYGFSVRCVKN